MFILNRNIQQILKPQFMVLAGVALFISLLTSIVFAAPTHAAMTTDTPPSERAQSYSYWKATSKCVRDHMRSIIHTVAGTNGATTPSQGGGGGLESTQDGEWFDDLTAYVAVYPDGKLDCDDVMKKALALWGWSDYKTFLQDMGYKFNSDKPAWERTNDTGDKRFEAFKSAVLKKVGNVVDLFDGAAKYQLYLGSFTTTKTALSTCGGKKIGALASVDETIRNAANNNQYRDGVNYTVIKLAEGSSVTDFVFTYKKNQSSDGSTGITLANHGSTWNYRGTPNDTSGQGERYTCEELVKMINANAPAYKAWAGLHVSAPDPVDPATGVAGDETDCTGEECEAVSTCAIDGIGWLVCPVVNFLAGMADGAFQFIADNLLRTDVNILEQGGATYGAWAVMRNLANVAFVIVFLIIIFSQMTGSGVSNYGVKKMLPRLIIAAILVNVSFLICQLAVDISNILGYSIGDALTGVGNSIIDNSQSGDGVSPFASGTTFTDIGVAILAGGFAVVALYALLSSFIPIILAAIVALVMILFILLARQALIVILIVLAPLAFVAFLLPNTQKLFTQWRKMFTALLLLFPIIALVFGLSKLASGIVTTTFSGDLGDTEANSWYVQIIGAAILILPLFVVPTLLKKSLDSIPVLGQLTSRWSSKANSRVGSKLKEGYQKSTVGRGMAIRKRARENYKATKFAQRISKGGIMGTANQVMASGIPVLPSEIHANRELKKAANAEMAAAIDQEHKDAVSMIKFDNLDGKSRQELATTGETTYKGKKYKGETLQRAALEMQVSGAGSMGEIQQILRLSSAEGEVKNPVTGKTEYGLKNFSQTIGNAAISGGVSGKDPAISGKTLNAITQGTFNYADAVLGEVDATTGQRSGGAIREGKFNAAAFAGMHDAARAEVIQLATQEALNGNHTYVEALQAAAVGIEETPELKSKLTGNKVADAQFTKLMGVQDSTGVPAGIARSFATVTAGAGAPAGGAAQATVAAQTATAPQTTPTAPTQVIPGQPAPAQAQQQPQAQAQPQQPQYQNPAATQPQTPAPAAQPQTATQPTQVISQPIAGAPVGRPPAQSPDGDLQIQRDNDTTPDSPSTNPDQDTR